MATRKIVPRADNEGGIGTALKRWATAFINVLKADSATIGSLSGIVKAAAGVLSATALGAADLKFFMNAAGDAPEWASGIKINSFTRDMAAASGNVDYTGVGFKPSHVIFLAADGLLSMCIGLDNGTTPFVLGRYYTAAWVLQVGQSRSLFIYSEAGKAYGGYIYSLNADGFTIAWTKTGEITGTLAAAYAAFR